MDTTSQQKVIAAGFTIIRCDDQPSVRIKYKGSGQQEWKTLENYPTKSARDRAFKELLNKTSYITD